jgi:cytochrome c oxidase subunit 1
MIGFTLWCTQILGALLDLYGSVGRMLGFDYVLRGSAFDAEGRKPPPPQMFAAAMVAIDGFLASTAGMTVMIGLIVRWADASVKLDPLWAKNLTYFFGHSFANLTMYMAVAAIYVGLPICTKREYHTSRPLAIAWWGSLTFVVFAYFHHLYMDFVQTNAFQYIGEIASYLAAIPVAVITVYGGVLLVHRSGMRWSMGAMFLYAGMIGWVVGGIGALLDATLPFNFDLHNTLWVPAHFHTYLLEGVLLFTLGWAFVSLEQRSESISPPLVRWLVGLCLFGGGAIFLVSFYLAGSSGVLRRVAVEAAPGPAIAGVASIGAIVVLLGLLLSLIEGIRLARLPRKAVQ